MTDEQSRSGVTPDRERATEEQARQFRPIGEQEGAEDAKFRKHDSGTESSAGEPAEANGRD